jgi:hypothetical protein
MLTWTDAHRIANIAVAQAHHDLAVDPAAPPIDVAKAIADDDVPLMWRPMPRLFGAYLNSSGSRPGVLVNSAIPAGARRHTAAHELGHHRLRHSATIDDGACLHLDPLETEMVTPAPARSRWTDQEKTAEAFAAWFLMPRRAVVAAMQILGIERPETGTQVYQLSLLLGTSYRSTVRHLPNLRLASHDRARAWATEIPGRIKARLDPTRTGHRRGSSDIWSVDHRFNHSKISIQQGDQLIVSFADNEHLVVSGESCLVELPGSTGTSRVWLATDALGGRDAIAAIAAASSDAGTAESTETIWTVAVVVEAPPAGLDKNWVERMGLSR